MRKRLKRLGLEVLEARDVPAATWASVADNWRPGTFEAWVPNAGGVEWFVSTVELADGFHQVLYAGDGGGARVVVVNLEGTAPVLDRVFFDAGTWRAGVGEVASIDSTLYVTPGVGEQQRPGPVYGKIDLVSGATSYHVIPGFDPEWRGGTQIAVTDIDWVPGLPGGNSSEPEQELVFLPGGTPDNLPGNVFYVVNSEDDSLNRAVGFGDPSERRRLTFAPAMFGMQFPDGSTGMALQPLDAETVDGRVEETILVRWDGVLVEDPTRPEDRAGAGPARAA